MRGRAASVLEAIAAVATVTPAMDENDRKEVAAAPVCASCGASRPVGQNFCTACGAEATAPSRRTKVRSGGGVGPRNLDKLEQAKGRREFARVKSIAFSMRALFFSCAFLALVEGLWELALRSQAPEDQLWIVDLVLVLAGSEVLLSMLGGLMALRAPLPWTVVAACYYSLNTTLALVLTDFARPSQILVRLFGVVCLWCGVAQAARLRQLMAADPSLSLRIGKVAPERQVHGGVVDQARARRQREGRARRVRHLQLAGAIVAGLILVVFAFRWLSAPPTVDASVARFQAAWRQAGSEDLHKLIANADPRLPEALERRGWTTSRPPLGTMQLEATENHARAVFGVGAEAVTVQWGLVERRWTLGQIGLPALQPTAIEPALQAFRDAWHAAGTEALVALFREDSRDRLGRSLVRILTKREWHEQRPKLTETYPSQDAGGRRRVGFGLAGEQVDVAFEYWHPQWYVVVVSLP